MFEFVNPPSRGSVVIYRDIEDVFDYLASPKGLGQLLRINVDERIALGMAVEQTHRFGPIEGTTRLEVTEYERPWKIHLRATGVPKQKKDRVMPPMDFTYELRTAPGGARLTETHRQHAGIVVLPLAILSVPLHSWSIRRGLRKLKAEIESGRW
jgi:hypothetical protein